jgi:hypothetical protein
VTSPKTSTTKPKIARTVTNPPKRDEGYGIYRTPG